LHLQLKCISDNSRQRTLHYRSHSLTVQLFCCCSDTVRATQQTAAVAEQSSYCYKCCSTHCSRDALSESSYKQKKWKEIIFLQCLVLREPRTKHENPLTPNDHYSGRTAPLTSKRFILYIYSTNTGTEYFKHGIYTPFSSLQNAVCFIILMYLVPVLFSFYIQDVLKFKKIIPTPKG